MSPNLLEREQFLASLDERLARAGRGNGQCVLLGGETGIGKTSLLEHFAEQHCDAAHFLWGRCEALYTPRPLGPLHDMALRLDGLAQVLADATPNRAAIFSDFLRLLQVQCHQVALIFEDVHWADEATLDLIKFLGRRLQQTSILLLVTYRDDEVGADHKLWFVFGDLPIAMTTHLHLPILSEAAVAQLAREAHRPADDLYAITGGNPFFVSEVLRATGDDVPETVRAAVLARASRLSPAARAVLDLAQSLPDVLNCG